MNEITEDGMDKTTEGPRAEGDRHLAEYSKWLWDNKAVLEIKLADRLESDGSVTQTTVRYDKASGLVTFSQPHPTTVGPDGKTIYPKGTIPAVVTIPAFVLQALMPQIVTAINRELELLFGRLDKSSEQE